jgi:hypothetical protein
LVADIEGGTRNEDFENKVLRRLPGPKRDEVEGECKKLHNEKLNDLNSTSNIFWVIISRRMK